MCLRPKRNLIGLAKKVEYDNGIKRYCWRDLAEKLYTNSEQVVLCRTKTGDHTALVIIILMECFTLLDENK
jgi:hypothetical protein